MHRLTVQDWSEHPHRRAGPRMCSSQPLQLLGWVPSADVHLQSLLLCLFPSIPEPSHCLPKRLTDICPSCPGAFPCVSELRNQGLAQSPVLFVRSSLKFFLFYEKCMCTHTHLHTHTCAVAEPPRQPGTRVWALLTGAF